MEKVTPTTTTVAEATPGQPTNGDRISGGNLLGRALKNEGVAVLFTL